MIYSYVVEALGKYPTYPFLNQVQNTQMELKTVASNLYRPKLGR